MLFKSALVTQISGSIGGMTGSHNRGGMYLRARVIPTDPGTILQTTMRAIIANLTSRWNDVLTAGQRTAWNLYASRVTLLNPLGDAINVSGINQYVRSNAPRAQTGNTLIEDAPTIFDLGSMTPLLSIGASEATQIITVSFTATDLWNLAGGRLLLYSGKPTNAGVTFFKGPYRVGFQVSGDDPGVSPAAIPSQYVISQGQRVWVRAQASFPDGRLSTSQRIGPIPVAA
ncbi:hypothetical protein LCGC14_1725150 [marine sediment metagenome]|uniref:Uncharacterized protein n=1 Tax=marine sediment metagenome TaxID=412755 RepID=A0A0F9HB23_9ZZZZ